ncbi:MAG: ASCH domain-containing protein [Candidatus Baldrarchaeia archaeon]
MKYIELKRQYREKVLKGKKCTTIRLGTIRRLSEGDEVFIHCGGKIIAKARVRRVEHKKVKDLTDEDAHKDGFKSRDELIESLKYHYGNVSPESNVTIIEFDVIEKYGEGIDPESLYYGKIPVDYIARLALEHLELTKQERRILEMISVIGSIRKVAQMMGGMKKRRKIRELLRRVYEELRANGMIPEGR